jgi:transposase
MTPAYVKPYVKRGKTDAADAAAICEAVTRSTMRFVAATSREQQAACSMHRARNLLCKQRIQRVNTIRGLLVKFGFDIPEGLERALLMARRVVDGETPDVPERTIGIVGMLSQQALDMHARLREIDRARVASRRTADAARRLATIPGIGPVGATALAASVSDPGQFRSARQFAAWLGLIPLQNSSGGKERVGRITKMGANISASGSSSAPRRWFGAPGIGLRPWTRGSSTCSHESPCGWRPSPWLTRWRGSSGR